MDDWDGDSDPFEAERLGELAALWTPDRPEDLWRELVVHSGQSSTHHWEAVGVFDRMHRDGKPGALTTAQLLCTDWRWRDCTGRLVAGVVETGILGEDDLDALARCFLWSARFHFEYPVSWIGTEWVGIDLGGDGHGPPVPVLHLHPDTPVPVDRRIPPPLRRWAAARILRSDPGAFDRMADQARELATIDGGAVVSGMLDVVGALGDHLIIRGIDLGLGWAMGSVRLHAIELLAARDHKAAMERAAADPDAKVRAWSPRPPRNRVESSPRRAIERPPRAQKAVKPEPPEAQATLFDD